MRTQQRNQSDLILHDKNTSQGVLDTSTWISSSAGQSTGTTVFPWHSNTDKPVESASGIVPGMIASGLFICFVLAVYLLLWRCMVAPRRRKKKKMRRVVDLDPSPLPC